MLCPKCNHEIVEETESGAAITNEAHEPPSELTGNGIYYRLALRFSANQFIILCGCALLLVSLNFTFAHFPHFGGTNPVAPVAEYSSNALHDFEIAIMSHTWQTEWIPVSGYGLMIVRSGWGWRPHIIYPNVMELLVPLVAVAVLTIAGKKLAGSNLLILGISVVGLLNGLVRLMDSGWRGAGIGLLAFTLLWVIITVAAFFEYEGVHPLE